MWFVPSWAVGVVVIVFGVSLAKGLQALLQAQATRVPSQGPRHPDVAQLTEALDEVQRRVGELEERLDFAERLLARQREGERLAPPQH
ncbi:MAG TPA: hypothetical protein VH158_03510 [Gemmatimonadales bacterium]|jgi:hypothetical protein|nr:hypothetical protein [Gemmatimonadales bacterium]